MKKLTQVSTSRCGGPQKYGGKKIIKVGEKRQRPGYNKKGEIVPVEEKLHTITERDDKGITLVYRYRRK